jgi:hypothetical protein
MLRISILGVLLMARADWPLAASSGSAGRAQPGIARTPGRTGQQDTLSPRPNLLPESIPLLPTLTYIYPLPPIPPFV